MPEHVTPVVLVEQAAPATPATGRVAVYAKVDGKVYRKDDAGTEAELGAGAHPDLATHDTLGLATQAELDAHAAAGDPHAGYLQESVVSGLATPAITLGLAAAAGTGTTPIRHDSTIAAFDATNPTTQAFADAAAVGTAAFAARRDHKHAMPANPVTAHEAHGNPHPVYATDGELTTHVGAADPHTGYVLESLIDAAADLIVGTADNTVGRLAKGAALDVLRVNAGATALEWAAPAGGALEWVSYTPTLTALTLGNGTVTARWVRIGRTIHYYFRFVLGSTSAVTGTAGFTLPTPPADPRDNADHYGTAVYGDFGTGQSHGTVIYTAGTVYFKMGGPTNVSNISATTPFTWATNDAIVVRGTYEAAS